MKITESKKYKKDYQRLKKNTRKTNAIKNIEKILIILYSAESLDDLLRRSSKILTCNFEVLHNDMQGYYSFRLNKNKDGLRLIISVDNDTIYFEGISFRHYEDFKRRIK